MGNDPANQVDPTGMYTLNRSQPWAHRKWSDRYNPLPTSQNDRDKNFEFEGTDMDFDTHAFLENIFVQGKGKPGGISGLLWATLYLNSGLINEAGTPGGADKDEPAKETPVTDYVMNGIGDKPVEIAPGTPMLLDKERTYNPNAFNCHSYTWLNSMGSPSDPENDYLVERGTPRWDDNPLNNTIGYHTIPFDEPNQVGDRIIYMGFDDINAFGPTHSAQVTKVDSKGNAIEVESKWGYGPVYRHHPRDVPNFYSFPHPSIRINGHMFPTRQYYRKD